MLITVFQGLSSVLMLTLQGRLNLHSIGVEIENERGCESCQRPQSVCGKAELQGQVQLILKPVFSFPPSFSSFLPRAFLPLLFSFCPVCFVSF